jgi:hypothetical protein
MRVPVPSTGLVLSTANGWCCLERHEEVARRPAALKPCTVFGLVEFTSQLDSQPSPSRLNQRHLILIPVPIHQANFTTTSPLTNAPHQSDYATGQRGEEGTVLSCEGSLLVDTN